MSAPVLWAHTGPGRHGVHRFGAVLAAVAADGRPGPQVRLPEPGEPGTPARLAAAVRAHRSPVVVLQFTDRLWGADPETAADRFEATAAASAPARVVVGLHDVPTAEDVRRRAAYARVVAAADRVVVCSEHERRRLAGLDAVAAGPSAAVVPHFVERAAAPGRARRRGGADVGVLGFVYPGKGHADVLAAAGRLPDPPPVLVVGGAAPGHADVVDELTARARRTGVPLRVTGWVPDRVLVRHATAVAVAVVPNCAPSASGSLATWLAAGRTPLVRDGDYAREVAELLPGCVELYPGDDPDALAGLLDRARHGGTARRAAVPASVRPEAIARRWVRAAEELR